MRRLVKALGFVIGVPLLLVLVHGLLFSVFPVVLTPLMLIRAAEGEGLEQEWVPLEEISPHMARAVIAAEDNRFCTHSGIDFEAVKAVVGEYRDGGRLRGASTISMQTIKNLYLWPGRSWIRKGLELILVPVLELGWDKRRIMEVYLNIVELGPGVYGVEAASWVHFGRSAEDLTRTQATALAAILPAPRSRDPYRRTDKLNQRVRDIKKRVNSLGEWLDCVDSPPRVFPLLGG